MRLFWSITDRKKRINVGRIVAAALVFCLFAADTANAEPVTGVITQRQAVSDADVPWVEEPKESALYAKSAVLMDADSGRILYAKNGEEILPMASTTKIMTLLIALEEGDPDAVAKVSSYAAKMPDVQLNIREGEEYCLRDLLYSLMLESHNDSAVAVAECVAGSVERFAERMNRKAEKIGCRNTTFITPNGLDAEATLTTKEGKEYRIVHSTTAEDLARILSYCVTKSPKKEEFLAITQTPTYTFSDLSGKRTFTCRNHNALLYSMEGALSGKTGFTAKAGYCYVGAVKRDGKTLTAALLACGWPNNKTYKWKDMAKLMEYGFADYETVKFETAASDIPINGTIPVINGRTDGLGEDAFAVWERKGSEETILLRYDETIETIFSMEKELKAPVKAGTKVGCVEYRIGGKTYEREDIFLKNSVEERDYAWCLMQTFVRFLRF